MYAMPKEQQHKIALEPSPADRILEGLALAGLVVLLAVPAVYYSDLPDTIPTHFNAAGEADDYGPKITIWLLPLIGLGLYVALTLINRQPQIFNYPVKITPENAGRQYQLATRLIRLLKAGITWMFVYLCWLIVNAALTARATLGPVFLWIVLGGVSGTIGWYMWQAYRDK